VLLCRAIFVRAQFQHYYQPTSEEFERIWKDALVVPDASLLLNMYRYSVATRDELVQALKRLRPQLWLPHQAGEEFHRNRLNVIEQRQKVIADARKSVEDARRTVQELYRSPVREPPAARAELDKAWQAISSYLDAREQEAPRLTTALGEDPIWSIVSKLFEGRVGSPFDRDMADELYAQGRTRYSQGVPPGYSDEKKPEPDRYGDYILWRQMIEQAKSTSKPIIFVTADEKTDWWLEIQGRTMGPLPALCKEMMAEAGQMFYMYRPDRFLEIYLKYSKQVVDAAALDELRHTESDRSAPDGDEARGEAVMNLFAALAMLTSKEPNRRELLSEWRSVLARRRRLLSEQSARLTGELEGLEADRTPEGEERRLRLMKRLETSRKEESALGAQVGAYSRWLHAMTHYPSDSPEQDLES
jgi:hypothetical protein